MNLTMEQIKAPTKAKQLQLEIDAIEKLSTLAPYHEQGAFVSRLIHNAHVLAESDKIAQRLRTKADRLRTLADQLQNQ